MLRNRKTGEEFLTHGKEVVGKLSSRQSFFQTPPTESKQKNNSLDLDGFINDFATRLPSELSVIEQKNIMTEMRKICEENKKAMIDFVKNNADILEEKNAEKLKNILTSYEEPSLLKSMGSLLLSSAFPKAALLFAFIQPAAAQNGLVIHSGQPKGGQDLCDPYISGCIQGYLTNGTSSWTAALPQYDRVVKAVGDNQDVLAYQQLKDCMSNSVMGKLVADAYSTGKGTPSTCAYQTSYWGGYIVEGQATSIPVDACPPLQSNVAATGQQCQSFWGALGEGAKIALGLGLGVGGICLCWIAYEAAKRKYCPEPQQTVTVHTTPVAMTKPLVA